MIFQHNSASSSLEIASFLLIVQNIVDHANCNYFHWIIILVVHKAHIQTIIIIIMLYLSVSGIFRNWLYSSVSILLSPMSVRICIKSKMHLDIWEAKLPGRSISWTGMRHIPCNKNWVNNFLNTIIFSISMYTGIFKHIVGLILMSIFSGVSHFEKWGTKKKYNFLSILH